MLYDLENILQKNDKKEIIQIHENLYQFKKVMIKFHKSMYINFYNPHNF